MKSKIVIEINSDVKRFYDKEDNIDITDEVEENFHDSVHKAIEEFIVYYEEFEYNVLDEMADDEQRMPREGVFDDFTKLGKISIKISQDIISKSKRTSAEQHKKLDEFER